MKEEKIYWKGKKAEGIEESRDEWKKHIQEKEMYIMYACSTSESMNEKGNGSEVYWV